MRSESKLNMNMMNLSSEERQKEDQESFESHVAQAHHPRHLGQGEDVGQLKLNRRSSIGPSSTQSQQCSGASTPFPPSTGALHHTQQQQIRKYLVLLQDCLAIKFVPCVSTSSSFPLPFNLPSSSKNNNRNQNIENRHNSLNPHNDTLTTHNQHCTHHSNNEDHLDFSSCAFSSNNHHLTTIPLQQQPIHQKNFPSPRSSTSMSFPTSVTGPVDVDHSLHGLYLYKGFREENLQCYWNNSLYEAVRNLEYKGYIVPFTVLISAMPRFLITIRTAWSRQMLRSPSGYRIEFIGEIEELLADPIQQSQFAPLSDSLCWAILEVTSSGQEAFVDTILSALVNSFPTMIMPNRELVYQTLEKLIKERKVYQTSNGYFVVTPDTFRYMISSSPLPQTRSPHYPYHHHDSPTFSTRTLTLDTLSPPPLPPDPIPHDPDKVSRNSWDSTASAENPLREREREKKVTEERDLPLRRHNSLKIIRQRDKEPGNSLKFLRGRSLSFRLYKSKSTPIGSEGSEGPPLPSGKENITEKDEKNDKKGKGGKSFFKKLFKRSSIKKSTSEPNSPTPIIIPSGDRKMSTSASAATQTSSLQVMELLSLEQNQNQTQEATSPKYISPLTKNEEIERKLTPRSMTLSFPISNSAEQLPSPCWNSLPKYDRPCSRLSSNTVTLIDDGPLYSYPNQKETVDGGNGNINRQNLSKFTFPRGGESSRCSSLSRGTSLGYGSQGPASSLVGFNSQSPTPSMSTSNYKGYSMSRRSILPPPGPPSSTSHQISRNSSNYGSYKNSYDYYRRRYPSYGTYQQKLSSDNLNNCPIGTTPREKVMTTTRPTSQPHYYETIAFHNKSTNADPKKSSVTETIGSPNPKKSESQARNTFPSPKISNRQNNEPFVSTTTVTQKSTTNMEVELRLPLGKFMRTSPSGRRSGGSTNGSTSTILIKGNDTKFNVNVGSGDNLGGGTEIHIGQEPRSETEVKTTVNRSNGTVEAYFDSCDMNSSRSGLHHVQKDLHEQPKTSGFQFKPKMTERNGMNGLRRDSYDFAVKVTDLDKDSDNEEFM